VRNAGSGFRLIRTRNHLLLAALAGVTVTGLLAAAREPAHAAGKPGGSVQATGTIGPTADCNAVTTCYTPQQVQVAYGVKPLLDRGIDGRGETVVLPEVGQTRLNPPLVSDLRQDMVRFDSRFHLPAARLRVVTGLGGSSSPWLAYGALDAEMVRTITPRATIVIVLLPPTALDNTRNAIASATASLRLASTLGGVISVSEGGQVGGERCVNRAQARQVNAVLRQVARRHVTAVAASGDSGAATEACSLARGPIPRPRESP
jgi:subtilase family serine protease